MLNYTCVADLLFTYQFDVKKAAQYPSLVFICCLPEFPRCSFPTFGTSAVNVTIYNTTEGILMTSYTCRDGSIGHLQCVADDTWSSDPARVCMDTFTGRILIVHLFTYEVWKRPYCASRLP